MEIVKILTIILTKSTNSKKPKSGLKISKQKRRVWLIISLGFIKWFLKNCIDTKIISSHFSTKLNL